MNNIRIVNGYQNNLKNIDLEIPRDKITVFTGVSGSGKSSIVFDTIAQESQRQLNETYPSYVRSFMEKNSRPNVEKIENISPSIIIDQKKLGGNARSTLGTVTEINSLFRVLFSRFAENNLPMNFYSFNDPHGMCEHCMGIGQVVGLDIDKAIDKNLSLNEGAILLPGYKPGTYMFNMYAKTGVVDADKKICDYTAEEYEMLMYGNGFKVEVGEFNISYEGLYTRFMRTNINTDKEMSEKNKEKLAKFTSNVDCDVCAGSRFNEQVLNSTFEGHTIAYYLSLQLDELKVVLEAIDNPQAQVVLDELIKKVNDLCEIGLQYLSLNRQTSTLSGGESQRVKLVKYLGSSLTGMLYILDEPSTGLHPKDVYRLNQLLAKIRDKGNTVLVVEHDPDVIKEADHIIDVGPHAGSHGGEIMYSGSYEGLLQTDTLTSKGLQNQSQINLDEKVFDQFYKAKPSRQFNLKNVGLEIPKAAFSVVCGVSGSGKSTLINNFIKEYPDVIYLDQNSLNGTIRSNVLTYLGIYNDIRKLYAKENGVEDGLFSANSKGGCPTCKGHGTVEINISYMDPIEQICDSCHGTRFIDEVLDYKYKDKNIVQLLDMTVEESLGFFETKKINKQLEFLQLVGLSYIKLGQSLNTLSGGESQRLKIASYLSKKGNIYVLDEPTTGLHMANVDIILDIIKHLVANNNTVIVIEHNTAVIKSAEYIVEVGPHGGNQGGYIIHQGNLKSLLANENSITKDYL